jgi:hypothetical protein
MGLANAWMEITTAEQQQAADVRYTRLFLGLHFSTVLAIVVVLGLLSAKLGKTFATLTIIKTRFLIVSLLNNGFTQCFGWGMAGRTEPNFCKAVEALDMSAADRAEHESAWEAERLSCEANYGDALSDHGRYAEAVALKRKLYHTYKAKRVGIFWFLGLAHPYPDYNSRSAVILVPSQRALFNKDHGCQTERCLTAIMVVRPSIV